MRREDSSYLKTTPWRDAGQRLLGLRALTGPRRRTRRNAAVYVLASTVTLGLSYLALSSVHPDAALRALRRSDYLWLLPALGLLGLALLARALRWRCLFPAARRPPLHQIGSAMMIGYLYNSILPGRVGELARVVALRRRSALPTVEIAGTALLDRVYDLVGILLMLFCAQPWLPRVGWLGPVALTAGVAAAALIVGAPILAFGGEPMVARLLRPLARLPRMSEARLQQVTGELTRGLSGLRAPRVALAALAWTLIGWLMSALVAFSLTFALHLHLGFSAALLIAVAVGLAMILPAPPAAIGVFEGAVLLALRPFAVSHSTALSYALVLHLVNFAPPVLVGIVLAHLASRRRRSRRTGSASPDPLAADASPAPIVAGASPGSPAMDPTPGSLAVAAVTPEPAGGVVR